MLRILLRHSIPFHRAKNITPSEWFEILYTLTTTCCKNILKISGRTSSRKPNYGIFNFSIFLVHSCFSNPETPDKIRIFPSSLWNFSYFSTFKVDSTLKIQNLKSEFTLTIILTVYFTFTSLSDEFLVQLQTTNAKRFFSEFI